MIILIPLNAKELFLQRFSLSKEELEKLKLDSNNQL